MQMAPNAKRSPGPNVAAHRNDPIASVIAPSQARTLPTRAVARTHNGMPAAVLTK
jgi:hypothetical protein